MDTIKETLEEKKKGAKKTLIKAIAVAVSTGLLAVGAVAALDNINNSGPSLQNVAEPDPIVLDIDETDMADQSESGDEDEQEEKKRGFEKGLQDGKLEIAMQKLEQVDQSVAFMESVEGKMADIVMKALKSCVVEIGDREMVVNIVRKTMSAVIRTQRHVTLKPQFPRSFQPHLPLPVKYGTV